MTHEEKIQAFADLVEKETIARLVAQYSYPGVEKSGKVTVRPGKKYTKVDVGDSGKYMVDEAGKIFGIKAYGVINKRHYYGTLDDVQNWNWSGYSGVKK